MRDESREEFLALCTKTIKEQDSNRLLELLKQMSELIEQKEKAGERQVHEDFGETGSPS